MLGFTHESAVNESVEWYTPPEIFEALGLTFDLDPCSPGAGKSYVPALQHYTAHDDGLAQDWGTSLAWVNPPYGPSTKLWMEKLAHHGNGIAMVFARTDVRWFQEYGVLADTVCFVNNRVYFYQGDIAKRGGRPGAGSMLLAYGPKAAQALRNSGLGACFTFVPGTEVFEDEADLFTSLDG